MKHFESVSLDAWRAKIAKDLRGAEYSSVVSFTEDGIKIDPAMHAENSPSRDCAPASSPLYRGSKTKNNDWTVVDFVQGSDATTINKDILNRLNAGATGLRIDGSITEYNKILQGVMPEHIELYFELESAEQWSELQKWDQYPKVKGGMGFDPIGRRVKNTSFDDSPIDFAPLVDIATNNSNSLLRTFRVDASLVGNAGGRLANQMAYALGVGHDYLVAMLDGGMTLDQAAANIEFNFSVGLDFFSEIAKLRTFRRLWARIVESYSPEHPCSVNTWITAESARFELSHEDENTNILRNTSAAMAAAVAGVDSICVTPHNLDPQSSFGNRIARNIQLLLKEESHLDQVIDPSAGSYLVEYLCEELERLAWAKFIACEEQPTFWDVLLDGQFQQDVRKEYQSTVEKLNHEGITRIGVNKFRTTEAQSVADQVSSDARCLPQTQLSYAYNPQK